MKYRVMIHESIVHSIVVEADSDDEARQKAEHAYQSGEKTTPFWKEMLFSEVDDRYQSA